MHKLARKVRFSINPFLDSDAEGFNSYASKPAGNGLAMFFELGVKLTGDVEPATVPGRIVHLKALCKEPGFFGRKRFIQRRYLMGVQIVAYKSHQRDLGVMHLEQFLDFVRPVNSGFAFTDIGLAPGAERPVPILEEAPEQFVHLVLEARQRTASLPSTLDDVHLPHLLSDVQPDCSTVLQDLPGASCFATRMGSNLRARYARAEGA